MKDLTLVILAAGMGSRFGGLKQIEPVGPNGEFIIDYSIYDAIKAGFKKIVFVIKKENYEIFKETIGKRIEGKIDVSYAFQEIDDLPIGFEAPEGRVKPWGTGDAILKAKNYVDGNFAIINADDFYGRESFMVLSEFLKQEHNDNKKHFCVIGYKVSNTMTENGSVKRGICEEENGYLTKLVESKVSYKDGFILAEPLDSDDKKIISKDTLVSMNMIGFNKEIMDYLEKNFVTFLEQHGKELTSEYLIPDVIFKGVQENYCDVKLLETNAKWYGVTYKEDKEEVVEAIKKLIADKVYNENLWQ